MLYISGVGRCSQDELRKMHEERKRKTQEEQKRRTEQEQKRKEERDRQLEIERREKEQKEKDQDEIRLETINQTTEKELKEKEQDEIRLEAINRQIRSNEELDQIAQDIEKEIQEDRRKALREEEERIEKERKQLEKEKKRQRSETEELEKINRLEVELRELKKHRSEEMSMAIVVATLLNDNRLSMQEMLKQNSRQSYFRKDDDKKNQDEVTGEFATGDGRKIKLPIMTKLHLVGRRHAFMCIRTNAKD